MAFDDRDAVICVFEIEFYEIIVFANDAANGLQVFIFHRGHHQKLIYVSKVFFPSATVSGFTQNGISGVTSLMQLSAKSSFMVCDTNSE